MGNSTQLAAELSRNSPSHNGAHSPPGSLWRAFSLAILPFAHTPARAFVCTEMTDLVRFLIAGHDRASATERDERSRLMTAGKLMPRYHFNVYDGVVLLDKKGVELPDTMFARREAIRYAGVLLEEGARLESLGQEWRMEVTDGTELILFRLDFFVTPSPAIESLSRPE